MNTYYLYLIGQANSLVINQMLKFALYMYILDNTGSSVIYSNIIAFSMLPIIFFSPIAGWICDYVKKKKLIVMLDVTSGIILSLFFLLSNKVIAICIILFILQYSTTVYGYAEGSLGIAAIGATFYYSFTRRKWGSNKTNNLVIGIGGCVMITGIILWICQTRNAIFITILVLCSIIQFNINIFSIVCLSDIMRKTKEEYMGRIMGFVSMITNMFQPISQIIYGRGLEYTISGFGKFLIVIAVSILGISLYRKI